jgi:hypothetical protein
MSPSQEQALWTAREAIHEAMGTMACYAGMACSMAEIGDDAGVGYSVRRALAYMRFVIGAYNDLCATRKAIENSEGA